MQDPATFQPIMKPQFPEQEQLKCPRCDSSNTKFCYYNNYNLSQPRHFCKNCRRYWTKGGSLRNIPVGGGSRKNTKRSSSSSSKRSSSTSSSSVLSSSAAQNPDQHPDRSRVDQDSGVLDISGSFSSLLASNGQFGSLLEGLNPSGSGLKLMQMGGFGENLDSGHGLDSGPGLNHPGNSDPESYMGLQNGGGDSSSCWNGGGDNGWPDLAIYTPVKDVKSIIKDPYHVGHNTRRQGAGHVGQLQFAPGSNGRFGSLLDGLNPNGSGLKLIKMGRFGVNLDSGLGLNHPDNGNLDSYMGLQNGGGDSLSSWNGGIGWPDLAI